MREKVQVIGKDLFKLLRLMFGDFEETRMWEGMLFDEFYFKTIKDEFILFFRNSRYCRFII